MNENSGCAFQKSIFVGVQVSGVYLSTGDTVVNRKAYLWEFKYLVCIYLWKHQWATGKHICGNSSISGVLKLQEQQWATNPKTPKKQTVRKKQERLFESIL